MVKSIKVKNDFINNMYCCINEGCRKGFSFAEYSTDIIDKYIEIDKKYRYPILGAYVNYDNFNFKMMKYIEVCVDDTFI